MSKIDEKQLPKQILEILKKIFKSSPLVTQALLFGEIIEQLEACENKETENTEHNYLFTEKEFKHINKLIEQHETRQEEAKNELKTQNHAILILKNALNEKNITIVE